MSIILLAIWFLDDKPLIKLLISLFFSLYIGYKLNLTLNPKPCPYCFGTDHCALLQNQQIQLHFFSYFLTLFNRNFTKSVYLATLNKSEMIVLKMKAPEFHQQINELNTLTLSDFEMNPDKVQSFILCPGFSNLNFLLNPVKTNIYGKRLWTDLEFSIEPLLLMFYHSQGDWPVPKYYGACGDLIFEEYKGKPIINLLHSNFNKRVYVSVQLLKMAKKFTFDHPDFIFYFTDYSPYNLVYDSEGNVFLVDLDNVIMYNKSIAKEYTLSQSRIHTSLSNGYEYLFSPKEICSHYLSDHNYFSVCKYLLSHPEEGLLKEIPQKIIDTNLDLPFLLEECNEPSKLSDRITAGQKLLNLLEKIIENYKWTN